MLSRTPQKWWLISYVLARSLLTILLLGARQAHGPAVPTKQYLAHGGGSGLSARAKEIVLTESAQSHRAPMR